MRGLTVQDNVSVYHVEGDSRDEPADVLLCAQVGAKLTQLYPGWCWKVEIPPAPHNAVVIIRNLDLDARGKWGFTVPKDRLDASMRLVMIGGGEMLERWQRRAAGTDGGDIPAPIDALILKPQT